MKTNIGQFIIHLQSVFKEATRTSEFQAHAQKAGDAMKENVIKKLRSSSAGYSFIQSGQLIRVLKTNEAEVQTNKTGSKVNIGFGQIDDLNQQTKRGAQIAVTKFGEEIGLRPEPSLPSWIIAEFGRRAGSGASPSGIPSEFQVAYSGRDSSKEYVSGPFSTIYHMRKPIFFMANYEKHGKLSNGAGLSPRTHPGIHEGRMFRDGLAGSKAEINSHINEGFYNSIKSLANKYGGVVERA